MNKIWSKAIICLIMVALVVGVTIEASHTSSHQDCSCCSTRHQGVTRCHDTARACLCNYQLSQIFLPASNILLKLVFAGYLAQNQQFAYLYLSTDNIFHPPRA